MRNQLGGWWRIWIVWTAACALAAAGWAVSNWPYRYVEEPGLGARTELVIGAIVFWLAPSLTALLLGFVARWVYTGFRPPG